MGPTEVHEIKSPCIRLSAQHPRDIILTTRQPDLGEARGCTEELPGLNLPGPRVPALVSSATRPWCCTALHTSFRDISQAKKRGCWFFASRPGRRKGSQQRAPLAYSCSGSICCCSSVVAPPRHTPSRATLSTFLLPQSPTPDPTLLRRATNQPGTSVFRFRRKDRA
jgi:hypothetical protein